MTSVTVTTGVPATYSPPDCRESRQLRSQSLDSQSQQIRHQTGPPSARADEGYDFLHAEDVVTADSPTHPDENRNGGPDSHGGLALLADVVTAFFHRLLETPPLHLVGVLLLVGMLMIGSAMQVICLNFWLRRFLVHGTPGNYTIFAVSSVVFSLFFLVLLGLYVVVHRPNLSFARHGDGWWLLLFMGSMDALNSGLVIYAASHTAEVLQALFTSLVPIFAAFFTKWLLRDPRDYANPWVVTSFTLISLGVIIVSVFNLSHHDGDDRRGSSSDAPTAAAMASLAAPLISFITNGAPDPSGADQRAGGGGATAPDRRGDRLAWSAIFFLSVLPTVLMNIGQTLYMTRYTYDEDFMEKLETMRVAGRLTEAEVQDVWEVVRARSEAASSSTRTAPAASTNARGAPELRDEVATHVTVRSPTEDARWESQTGLDLRAHHPHHGEDLAVKLVMLAGGTTIQSLLTLLFMPFDALPWFGGSASMSDTWVNFTEGIDCLFHCPGNLACCCLYSMGFVLVYLSAAYLNQYSVTLCSMVSQMSGPITALILLGFPPLNLSGDVAPWYASVGAITLLLTGTFLYVVWDEQTEAEKEAGEVRYKLEVLGLIPGSGPSHPRYTSMEYVMVETDSD